MLEWQEYSNELMSVRLPRRMRQQMNGLFKGRLSRLDPKSEVLFVVQIDLAPELVEVNRECCLGPAGEPVPMVGVTYKWHHRGESRIWPGGVETQSTYTGPAAGMQGHNWTIIFPIGKRWLRADVMNPAGGLSWEDFEAIGTEIIKSIRLTSDKPPEKPTVYRQRVPASGTIGLTRSQIRRLASALDGLPSPIRYLREAILAIARQDQDLLASGEADVSPIEEALQQRGDGKEIATLAAADAELLQKWLESLPGHDAAWAGPIAFVAGFLGGRTLFGPDEADPG